MREPPSWNGAKPARTLHLPAGPWMRRERRGRCCELQSWRRLRVVLGLDGRITVAPQDAKRTMYPYTTDKASREFLASRHRVSPRCVSDRPHALSFVSPVGYFLTMYMGPSGSSALALRHNCHSIPLLLTLVAIIGMFLPSGEATRLLAASTFHAALPALAGILCQAEPRLFSQPRLRGS